MKQKEFATEIGGKKLTATFSDLAERANGSVELSYGNSRVLATAVMGGNARDGIDYFPLTVDYEEKFYAAGQILGSRFVRREGRPSDEAVLTGRAVDRTIRPLFDHRLRNEVQIVVTVLSIDEDDPDMLAINAASLALATSDIPWAGPVAAVRVGAHREHGFVVNPTYENRDHTDARFDLLVCGKDGEVNMIELAGREIPEEEIAEGLARAAVEISTLTVWQRDVAAEMGKAKRAIEFSELSDAVLKRFDEAIAPKLRDAVFCGEPGSFRIEELSQAWKETVRTEFPDEPQGAALRHFDTATDEELHRGVLEEGVRPDGRAAGELRNLYAKAGGISPILHGSGIFYRGGTHIFSALTLGGPGEAQVIDGMETQTKKRFLHHYNFPPFSVGETGRLGGMNRRAIGHGALAEKALVPIIPPKETFPYTIRIVSEVFASNGSSSMGSICGATLALMDGGVPITAPVAGIAMGLIMEDTKNKKQGTSTSTAARARHAILTDIQGPEDHHGDMDFKVAGTRTGVTAVQMDVKVAGVPIEVISAAFDAARSARLKILDVIEKEIDTPRRALSPNAPKIVMMHVRPDQIGAVIGSGGKIVNGIREATGTEIDIEDDGSVFISGKGDGPERAKREIEAMTREFKAGDRFDGVVIRLADFGAFVRIAPVGELGVAKEVEGLVHVSEIAPFRIERVADALTLGETVPVVVKEVDDRDRVSLSIKHADPDFASRKGLKPAPPGSGDRHTNNNHGRRGPNRGNEGGTRR